MKNVSIQKLQKWMFFAVELSQTRHWSNAFLVAKGFLSTLTNINQLKKSNTFRQKIPWKDYLITWCKSESHEKATCFEKSNQWLRQKASSVRKVNGPPQNGIQLSRIRFFSSKLLKSNLHQLQNKRIILKQNDKTYLYQYWTKWIFVTIWLWLSTAQTPIRRL